MPVNNVLTVALQPVVKTVGIKSNGNAKVAIPFIIEFLGGESNPDQTVSIAPGGGGPVLQGLLWQISLNQIANQPANFDPIEYIQLNCEWEGPTGDPSAFGGLYVWSGDIAQVLEITPVFSSATGAIAFTSTCQRLLTSSSSTVNIFKAEDANTGGDPTLGSVVVRGTFFNFEVSTYYNIQG